MAALAAVCGVLLTGGARAAPVLNPGNGHYYDVLQGNFNWEAARAYAAGLTYLGRPGHLITVTSAAEGKWFRDTFGANGGWIGGYQPPGSPEPAGGWQWITGEPFVYTNWNSGEPNNAGGEDKLHFLTLWDQASGMRWNDLPGSRYLNFANVEYDDPPPAPSVPEPGTLALLGLGGAAIVRRRRR